MVYYGYGWWWWWMLFLLIFFLLPLAYGWGYRGWGPWYRRRLPARSPDAQLGRTDRDIEEGWGWIAIFLWIALIIAVLWLIAGLSWGWGNQEVVTPGAN